jgi:hypothetical protein
MARLEQGQSAQQLVSFLKQAGVPMSGAFAQSVAKQAKWHREHPNTPVSQYDTSAIDHHTQQMGMVNRAANAFGQSDLGAGMIAAGNAALGNQGPNLIGALGGNEEQARLAGQYSAQDHPNSALAGSIVGGTAAALGGEAALGAGGMAAGFGRSLIADTAYGTVAGEGASPDAPVKGAIMGGLAGAAGSLGGQALTRGGGALARGVQNADVSKLVGSGVPLTIGQAVGGAAKKLEDKATSVPLVGDMIQSRRAEGVRVFNAKAFDKALEPIGGTVGGKIGQDAVEKARGVVSDAFGKALKGKTAVIDDQFMTSARGPLERLAGNKRLGPEIVNEIEQSTKGIFQPDGSISGEHMQAFLDALGQIRRGYKNDPLYSTLIKPSIQGIENAVEGMFTRQAPEVVPAFTKAKQAFRRVSILSDAVNAADNTDNIFTAAQLRRADLNNAKKYDGPMRAASGGVQFGDISRPAQRVLPSKVPDSGTAGRLALLAVPGAIAGSGAGVGYALGDSQHGAEGGLGLAGVLSLLYTKRGQSILVNSAIKRGAGSKAVGSALQKLGPVGGAAGAALTTGGQ